jgi:hypothetical protein
VTFDLRVAVSTRRRPVAGIPIGKRDSHVTVKSADGKSIPDGEYDLHPDERKMVFHVINSGGHWSLCGVGLECLSLEVSSD